MCIAIATPEIFPNPTVDAKTADNASKRDIPFSEFFFNKSENPPIKVRQGDKIIFYEIDKKEFNNIKFD